MTNEIPHLLQCCILLSLNIMNSKSNLVEIAKIVAAHGIKGQVKIKCFTREPGDIIPFNPLVDSNGRSFKIKREGIAKDMLIASIEGITDRNQSELLRGTVLYADREALPDEADEDSLPLTSLIGYRVETENGDFFGIVKAYHNFGAGDLLEISLGDSDKTEFFSFTDENFPEIDDDNQMLTIIPPEVLKD